VREYVGAMAINLNWLCNSIYSLLQCTRKLSNDPCGRVVINLGLFIRFLRGSKHVTTFEDGFDD
jgi:hypothetical protein